MKKLALLKLSENTKFNSGFIDELGVQDLKDIEFDLIGYYVDKEKRQLTIHILITDNSNFKQRRTLSFRPADLTKIQKKYLLDSVDVMEGILLNEPEFANAINI